MKNGGSFVKGSRFIKTHGVIARAQAKRIGENLVRS